MSEPFVEDQIRDEEGEAAGLACPECGRRFKNTIGLGMHRSSQHGVQGRDSAARGKEPRSRGVSGAKGAELNRLKRELKKDVSALCLLPFMAKGTAQNLTHPGVTQMIDEKAEGFADAWVAVAEQNDWVRKNLAFALAGGVWLNAAAQTAALGYVVAVFSGFAPLHPGALMLLPEMHQFVAQTQPTPPSPNGNTAEPSDD